MTPEDFARLASGLPFVKPLAYPQHPEQEALLVSRAKSHWPVGGNKRVTTPPGGAAAWTNIVLWHTGDGNSHRGTLVLSAQPFLYTPSIPTNLALAGLLARVRTGGRLGGFDQYVGVPNIIPFSAETLEVSVLPVGLPMQFSTDAQNPDNANSQTAWTNNGGVTASVACKALVLDDWPTFPPPVCLTSMEQTYVGGNAPNTGVSVGGPVFISSVTLTNLSNSVCYVVIQDTFTGTHGTVSPYNANFPNPILAVTVPANSSLSIGADALGPFFLGCTIAAVLSATAIAPYTPDPNGANVLCNVYGNLLY